MASNVGFFCQWKIKNFSFCVKERIFSPIFTVTMLKDTRWNLCLQKQAVNDEDDIVCILKRTNDNGPSNIKLFYELSIIGPDQKFAPKYSSRVEVDFEKNTRGQEISLMSDQDYTENFLDAFKKECLIVCCRMWKSEMTDTIKYFIRTSVKTHKRYLKWVLKDFRFSPESEYLLKYSERDSSPYKLQLYCRLEQMVVMDVYLVQIEPLRSQHVKCKISVLDGEGKTPLSMYGNADFHSNSLLIYFSLYMRSADKFECKDLLWPNNTLCLLVEMQMSGVGVDGMEQVNFGDGLDELLVSVKESKYPITQSNIFDANSLMGNLLNFYKDGRLCDVVLKTDSSSFPAHKVILCAQSSVFTAMLETDLKEKQTGTIPIQNMSDDTVQKMIRFMYTDQVESLSFEGALNLYFASDQYNIVQLKRLCRDFLKSNLDTSNITDALVVADLHHDEELRTASHDFIFEHDGEVIASDKWNQFMQDHLKLAAETMHLMYRRKLKT